MKKVFVLFIVLIMVVAATCRAAEYSLYFGDLHSHTSFSDGEGLPEEAYDMARANGCDFWTVSDHVEQIGSRMDLPRGAPPQDEWDYVREVAAQKTENGAFVAIPGFEWAMDLTQGHVNIFNVNEITNFGNAFPLKKMYKWLYKHPAGLMGFNHPHSNADTMNVFDHFKLIPPIVEQTIYVATNVPEDFPFYYMALDNGWWVGAVAQQDNHSKNWCTPRGNHTGVYAAELTFDSLLEAFKARRFFATNDRALRIALTGNGEPMGSRITASAAELEIHVEHADDRPIKSVSLISSGGKIIREWNPDRGSFDVTEKVSAPEQGQAWFVVLVQNDDARFAMSSPIFLKNQD